VTGVQAFGLFVELEEIYVQGLVHVSTMSDDYYRYDERAHTLEGQNAGRVYRLGDRVKVQVARADLERRQLDFALLDVLGRPAGRGGPARAPRGAPPASRKPAGATAGSGARPAARRGRGRRR
jgi:ribonuclease R